MNGLEALLNHIRKSEWTSEIVTYFTNETITIQELNKFILVVASFERLSFSKIFNKQKSAMCKAIAYMCKDLITKPIIGFTISELKDETGSVLKEQTNTYLFINTDKIENTNAIIESDDAWIFGSYNEIAKFVDQKQINSCGIDDEYCQQV